MRALRVGDRGQRRAREWADWAICGFGLQPAAGELLEQRSRGAWKDFR
jgi:hypothetical protein